jgi:hypothetical protein
MTILKMEHIQLLLEEEGIITRDKLVEDVRCIILPYLIYLG